MKALKRIGEYFNLHLNLGFQIKISAAKRRATLKRIADPGTNKGTKKGTDLSLFLSGLSRRIDYMMSAVDFPKGVSMTETIEGFLSQVPRPDDVRQRIAENLKERQLLRRVLKLAEERQATRSSCGQSTAEVSR